MRTRTDAPTLMTPRTAATILSTRSCLALAALMGRAGCCGSSRRTAGRTSGRRVMAISFPKWEVRPFPAWPYRPNARHLCARRSEVRRLGDVPCIAQAPTMINERNVLPHWAQAKGLQSAVDAAAPHRLRWLRHVRLTRNITSVAFTVATASRRHGALAAPRSGPPRCTHEAECDHATPRSRPAARWPVATGAGPPASGAGAVDRLPAPTRGGVRPQ
jgi:hypothetical protein